MLQTIAAFHAQQIDNLLVAYDVIANSIRNSQVPALDKLEKDVQATLLLTSIITIVLVIRPLRRVVLQTLEAILTIGLLLALISLVLGLPFCVFYIAVKGTTFLSISLLRTFPQLQSMVDQAQQAFSNAMNATS